MQSLKFLPIESKRFENDVILRAKSEAAGLEVIAEEKNKFGILRST